MTRTKLFPLGFVLLVACGELSRNPGEADGGATEARPRCGACDLPYHRCQNAECLVACESGEGLACGDGSRCLSGSCRPDHLPTCLEQPCNADQRCHSTYCVQALTYACDWEASTPCGVGGFCVPGSDECATLPPCDVDGACRVGDLGAVCNRKAPFGSVLASRYLSDHCLIGRCTSDDHCPAPLTCQEIGAEFERLGVCR